jgi:hypothetical protein
MTNEPIGALVTVAERLDRSVPVTDELGNAVLTDNSTLVRLTGPLFAMLSLFLVQVPGARRQPQPHRPGTA